ncbi:MAG: sugar kinase [Paracoccus sp. BP8]|nr:MAG: sugar kinase [Paracoccus sp. BP8]
MRILAIGEPLVEFTARSDAPSTFDRRLGGDTLNTAIYLARLMGPGAVGYLTGLGDDAMSRWLIAEAEAEEVGMAQVVLRPGGRPGLSFISTDAAGERSFLYWREHAPFRSLFCDAGQAPLAALEQAGTLFLSAITLAVLQEDGRARLMDALARRRKAGARIVFDTNYRPALWPNAKTAGRVIARAAGIATLVLPSMDDMGGCFGTAAPAEAMALLMRLTEAEIVLTTGGAAVLRRAAGETEVQAHALPPAVAARDTTGAGDSFNAAYLAARLAGLAPHPAILAAARLAAVVVQHPGAIIPRHAMPGDLPGLRVAS